MPVTAGTHDSLSELEQHLSHGRDHNGMYKNHQHYTKLRNKINEQENSHQELFQTVMEKLQDRTFLEQAMQMTEVPADGLLSSQSPMGISDSDTKCLVDRYPSFFKGKNNSPDNVRKSYSDDNLGSYYGLLPTCANNLTDYQAQHLLWQNPDLQQKYGKSGAVAQSQARSYFTDTGFSKGLDPKYYEKPDKAWYCGTYFPDQPYSTRYYCGCNGNLYMGPQKDPEGNKIETFQQQLQWKTKSFSVTNDVK
jgi:hypothetical protein